MMVEMGSDVPLRHHSVHAAVYSIVPPAVLIEAKMLKLLLKVRFSVQVLGSMK